MPIKSILHPTDFSECATQALKQAVRLAVIHDAQLHIYHGILLHTDSRLRAERELNDYVETARSEAASLNSGGKALNVTMTYDRSYSVFDSVLDKIGSLKPDLLVVGTHGRAGLTKFLMGSEAEKWLRHAPCNLLLLRADTALAGDRGAIRRVLVPVDFSESSRHALGVARTLVSGASGAITLLHVVPSVSVVYHAKGVTSRFVHDPDLLGRVQKALHEWSDDAVGDVLVTEGAPAVEIVRISAELPAEMVIMGTHGMTGLKHFLVGSVTENVCRHARTPVLVAR